MKLNLYPPNFNALFNSQCRDDNREHSFKKNFQNYNYSHNIMRIFDVLPNFPFNTRETKSDY